jgi:hypothetical protein
VASLKLKRANESTDREAGRSRPLPGFPGRTRLLTSVALMACAAALVAISDSRVAWTAAGLLAAFAFMRVVLLASEQGRPADRMTELQRHVSRCRRYEEPASLLVVVVPPEAANSDDALLSTFRICDSAAVIRRGGSTQLCALFDEVRADRSGIERRIDRVFGAAAARGWAAFPSDGVTLETLLEAAYERIRSSELDDGTRVGARDYASDGYITEKLVNA